MKLSGAVLCCLAIAMLTGCTTRTDAASREGSTTDSVLEAILEPFFASQDGKDPLANSEYRDAMSAQWRLSTEARYAFLVRELQLSPGTTDQLYDLLVHQIFETLEGPTQSVRSENGVPILTPEYQALKDKQDREVAMLIGEDGLAKLHEYDATFEFRNELWRLQTHFSRDTSLLREDQVDAMIAIMRNADEAMKRARPPGADLVLATGEAVERLRAQGLEASRRRDARILEASASVLDPAQYAALAASVRRERGYLDLLQNASEVIRVGKSEVARDPRNTNFLLIGANDDLLLKDPDYRRAWQLQTRLEAESTYIDVPRLLNLSPGLADRFFDLQVSQRQTRLENPRGPYHNDEETTRNEEHQLAALLGEHGFAQLQQWQDSLDARYRVRLLQIDIGAGPDALQLEQVEALVPIFQIADLEMQRASPPLTARLFTTRHERERLNERERNLRRQRDARIHGSAVAILTPAQLAALDAWLPRS